MDFKISNNENDSINVQIEFNVATWDELKRIMELLDEEVDING
jgi:hypothetical protein